MRASVGRDRVKPAKTGEFDGAITLCDKASERAGRAVLALAALGKLYTSVTSRCSSSTLAGITLGQYEAAFRFATKQAGLCSLKLTPPFARHGGVCHHSQGDFRTITEIQQRGRWEAAKSVARYKK